MIALAVMVVTCAILGTLAMSRMFVRSSTPAQRASTYVANSSTGLSRSWVKTAIYS